jgi:hypothetical protein
MSTTTDPNDPRLGHGVDLKPVPQHEVYLVLSEAERAKGFVRPVRQSYRHVGASGPKYPLADLTDEQKKYYGDTYAKYEESPPGSGERFSGRFWTQTQLDQIGKGCGSITTMNRAIAETYSRSPGYYGSTYCATCEKHLPVDEFIWLDGSRVGS